MTTHRHTWLLMGAASLCLVAPLWWYHTYIADDAFISLQYSRRLLAGQGLSFSDAVPAVEGYSNLLWVLLTAGLGGLGVDLVVAARIIGMGSVWALTMLVLRAWQGPDLRRSGPAIIAATAIIGSGGLGVWASGGLEAPLHALLMATSIIGVFPLLDRTSQGWRATLPAGISLALLALTRADGLIFTPVACGIVLLNRGIHRPQSWLVALQLAVLPAAAFGGQTLFRWAYYGDFMPNTARVKGSVSTERLWRGWAYQRNALWWASPLVVASLIAAAWAWWLGKSRGRLALIVAMGAAWFAYVITMGGDIFPGRRHAVGWTVACALLLAESLSQIQASAARPRLRTAALAVGGLAAIGFVATQLADRENWRARDRDWPWDAVQLGRELQEAFGAHDPVVAVNAAGALPYAVDFAAIDILGLNDGEIARHPTLAPGGKWIGHDTFNANILLGRKPDLIVFSDGRDYAMVKRPRPMYLELRAHPDFANYANTYLWFDGYKREKASVLVRRDSPKIGIERTTTNINVPAIFLSHRKLPAFARDGVVGLRLKPGRTAKIADLLLPAGHWTVQANGEGELDVAIADHAGQSIDQAEPGPVSITVRTASDRAILHSLTLRREGHPLPPPTE